MMTIQTVSNEAMTALAHCILLGLVAVALGIVVLGICIIAAASEMSQWESSDEEDDDDQSEAWKKADR